MGGIFVGSTFFYKGWYKMPKVTVIKPHRSKFPNPIKLCRGDRVKVGKRDSEYKDWIWCTTKSGVEGWVPEKYLTVEGDSAEVTRAYNATELDVDIDDLLMVIEEESGWYSCRTRAGLIGWVPVECVKVKK